MEECFKGMLPSNLYKNHYELNIIYQEYSPDEWRQYLKLNERYIMNEVAAITEAAARSALQKLGSGESALSSQDIAAIRQLLERSEQINSANQEAKTFVMMQFDTKEGLALKSADEKQMEVFHQNTANVTNMYNLRDYQALQDFGFKERSAVLVRNQDGTLRFNLDHKHIEPIDLAYMRLFNPENTNGSALPDFEDDPDREDMQ